jgi:hypothetical protein
MKLMAVTYVHDVVHEMQASENKTSEYGMV